VLEPAEFWIARIVGEQRVRAREHIFWRVAASVPSDLAGTLEGLLVVKSDENSSGLQAIKATFPPTLTEVLAVTLTIDLRSVSSTNRPLQNGRSELAQNNFNLLYLRSRSRSSR
jgi:hypothetical protein